LELERALEQTMGVDPNRPIDAKVEVKTDFREDSRRNDMQESLTNGTERKQGLGRKTIQDEKEDFEG
jgi:hypothetical protein